MSRNIAWKSFWTMMLSIGAAMAAETYISFDFPGATLTAGQGISDDGAMVGFYADSAGKQHGFLLSSGSFTSIDYPGSLSTDARGINSHGDIVGIHIDAAGLPGGGNHGYLLQHGVFTAMDYPGHLNTITQRITDDGVILGCYHDTDTMGTMHGMVIGNGIASELSAQASMNNGAIGGGAVVAGLYTDMMTGTLRAYVAGNGAFLPFDFPFSIATTVWDMSAAGEVAGTYMDAAKKVHSFTLNLGDSLAAFGVNPQLGLNGSFHFVSFDYPGAAATNARGINSRGDVVGFYVDSAGKTHGFFRSRTRRRQE